MPWPRMSNSSVLAFAVVACVSFVSAATIPGQTEEVAEVKGQPVWQQETLKIWGEQDSSAAFANLEASGPALMVAERYGQLAQYLYNVRKDLPGMILAARAGIQYSLQRAKELDSTDQTAASQLRGLAKSMAYNLGANCWPGWREPGISIGSTERAIGLDAARLNLRFAVELRRPPEPLGHAHWLLGAQLLAAKDHDAAALQFSQSAMQFATAKKSTEKQMAVCYENLARRLQHATETKYEEALKQSLVVLKALDNDDARFFAEQIEIAEKVFAQ